MSWRVKEGQAGGTEAWAYSTRRHHLHGLKEWLSYIVCHANRMTSLRRGIKQVSCVFAALLAF